MNEIYISVDIEAAGTIPGKYSMLSIGACVIGNPQLTFYVELKPINSAFIEEALNITGETMEYFENKGVLPKKAMANFRKWILGVCVGNRPVFVGFNAPFDWSFVNWYFHTYMNENPFGIGGVDIKAYYMGMTGCLWSDTTESKIPLQFKGPSPHTHNALDDAVQQAEMFELMRA